MVGCAVDRHGTRWSGWSRGRTGEDPERLRRHRATRVLISSSVRCNLPFVETYGSDGFGVLGDQTRRAIITTLSGGALSVGDIAATLPISRPAVSQHLKVLKDSGLVSERALGTRRIYRLNPTAVAALRDQLDTFWDRALTGYASVVEDAAADGGDES